MAADHDQAKQDYLNGMKYKDLAEKYGVSLATIKSWKVRYKWDRKGMHTKEECIQKKYADEKSMHMESDQELLPKKKRGAPKGSKNALGNKGGPGGPEGNDHAVKHGFFSRILPDDPEVHAIVEEIGKMSPLEILWHDIQLQMAIIARAQTLMYVKNQDDITEYLKRERRGRNPEKEYVLQGLTAAGAYADEAALFPESFVEQMIGRCSVEGSKIWMNCNPEGPFHYIKTEYIDKAKKKKVLHLHFTLDDNLSLSPKIKERYKRMFSGLWFKRFILGLWVLAEGVIYDMFDESIHVIDQLPIPFDAYYLGVDYGTGNPTVFLLIGQRGKNLYVMK